MEKEKKALSPVVATVLLIVIVVAIALIVFLWVRGMTHEAVTKFDNRNIELVCDDVVFEASYTKTTGLFITNYGNVPIFGMDIKMVKLGSHNTEDLTKNDKWPRGSGLRQGGIFSDENFGDEVPNGVKELILIPVLIGESDSGRKTHACDENKYGVKLSTGN